MIEYINKGVYTSECQAQGEQVQDRGYTNDWWTKLQAPDGRWGWVTNIYIKGAAQIAGVPTCGATPAPPVTPTPPQPKSVSVLVFKEAETFPCIHPHINSRVAGCNSNGKVQPNNFQAYCQQQGSFYFEGGWTTRKNDWWTLIQNGGSQVWVSNLDIKGAAIIEGVPQGPDACRANAPAGYPDGAYHP
ncbi:hypothetical protein KSF_099560 [Reticulibacter mediterranei]|uniref:SH3 domain-containing protein n=1 Tax=Reticulibacter mediterranei TaxID=2778369 RepID=A0A8J3N8P4_9CHLR|nr:hypothetical protein KSF_099560 [Reticulibacter mediterranei]